MLKLRIGLAFLAAVSLLACTSGNEKPEGNNIAASAQADDDIPFPLPSVPDSIENPQERANYTLLHFWENIDFDNPMVAGDSVLMEKGFSNFLYLLQYVPDSKEASAGIAAMYSKATPNPKAYRHLADLAEKYLYDPNSPMRSDGIYALFLESLMNGDVLSSEEKERLRYQKKIISMNAVGTTAPDFQLELRSGKQTTLHKLIKGYDKTLLIFYDPECENCHRILGDLTHDKGLQSDITAGKLQVVLVDIETDKEAWLKEDLAKYPPQWITAFNSDGLADKELYAIRATPTLFLLSKSAQILNKDL